MAITEPYANTATIGSTEYSLPNNSTTLTPITVDGVYQVFVDTNAMAAADSYALRVYETARSGGTKRLVYEAALIGVQAQLFVMPSMLFLHGWDVTLQKLAGTDRAFEWSIRQVA